MPSIIIVSFLRLLDFRISSPVASLNNPIWSSFLEVRVRSLDLGNLLSMAWHSLRNHVSPLAYNDFNSQPNGHTWAWERRCWPQGSMQIPLSKFDLGRPVSQCLNDTSSQAFPNLIWTFKRLLLSQRSKKRRCWSVFRFFTARGNTANWYRMREKT